MKISDTIKLLDKHCKVVVKKIPINGYGYVAKKMWVLPGVNYYITHDFHYDEYSKKWQEFIFVEAPLLEDKRTQAHYVKSIQAILTKIELYKNTLSNLKIEIPETVVKKA